MTQPREVRELSPALAMRRMRGMRMSRLAGSVLVAAVVAAVLVGVTAGRAGVQSRPGTIAFLRSVGSGPGTPSSLLAIQADGSGLRRLAPTGVGIASYRWSPDGSRIAYLDARGALWVVHSNGTGRQRLAARSQLRSPWFVAWSPNGKSVAVLAQDPTARPIPSANHGWLLHLRITVIPSGGGAPRRLPTGDVGWLAWSPRGDEIAYATKGAVWVIRSDGSDRTPLHVNHVGMPTWSPDGTHLGFIGCRRQGTRCVARSAGIYVADADGSNLHEVTGHAYNEYGFAWSPDGRNILYGRANRQGIYVIGADGRGNHRITHDSPPQALWGALSWSPDGRSIAYATDRTGNGDIYVIDADGQGKTRLTSSPEIDSDPAWAPR